MGPERSLSGLAAILERISRVERWISILAFVALICIVFVDVLSREVTGAGLHWARQFGVYANFLVVMAGFGMAASGGMHLRPRFADHWLPRRWDRAIEATRFCVTALFCFGFGFLGAQLVLQTFALEERSLALPVPVWPVQAVLPLVFIVGGLRYLVYAFCPELRPFESSNQRPVQRA